MKNCLISYRNVSVGYNETAIVQGISFELTKGEYLAIIGANGTGKSTIIRSIMDGALILKGRITIHESLSSVGYVPQRHTLKSHFPLTVQDIVLMGTYNSLSTFSRVGKAQIDTALEALEKTGMIHKGTSLYRDLSGGQQQKVLIARALASKSPLLILDEPCTGMDIHSEYEILNLLRKLNQKDNVSVILVTHDLNRAAQASTVAIIDERTFVSGKREEVLSPEKLSEKYTLPLDYLQSQRRGAQYE